MNFFIITSQYPVRLENLWMDKIAFMTWHDLYCESRDKTCGTAVTSYPRSTGTFWLVIYSKNHVTKRWTTSLVKDSEMESEACVCQKFYLEFETSFMLFTNFLLKEVNYWKKHWYKRVINALCFTFILLDPQKSIKKGKVPRKMLQTQVRPGLSVLA